MSLTLLTVSHRQKLDAIVSENYYSKVPFRKFDVVGKRKLVAKGAWGPATNSYFFKW